MAAVKTKTGNSRSFPPHVKNLLPTKSVIVDHLHTISGFAIRYGLLKRGEPYKTQQVYNGIDERTMVLTFHEINFPIILVDNIKLIVWNGQLS